MFMYSTEFMRMNAAAEEGVVASLTRHFIVQAFGITGWKFNPAEDIQGDRVTHLGDFEGRPSSNQRHVAQAVLGALFIDELAHGWLELHAMKRAVNKRNVQVQ